MTTSASFSCQIGTTDPSASMGMEIWFDDQQVFNQEHVQDTVEFFHDFPDTDGEHQLRFVMKNKTHDMTQIDQDGTIVADACLTISNAAFDEIDLGHMFIEQTKYHHDYNGTQEPVTAKFYGKMGCNGIVSLEFTTPIYLWLLENM